MLHRCRSRGTLFASCVTPISPCHGCFAFPSLPIQNIEVWYGVHVRDNHPSRCSKQGPASRLPRTLRFGLALTQQTHNLPLSSPGVVGSRAANRHSLRPYGAIKPGNLNDLQEKIAVPKKTLVLPVLASGSLARAFFSGHFIRLG